VGMVTSRLVRVHGDCAKPEVAGLPCADSVCLGVNGITGSGSVQTISTAPYDALTTALDGGRLSFLHFGSGD
jgi:hypothetical protein